MTRRTSARLSDQALISDFTRTRKRQNVKQLVLPLQPALPAKSHTPSSPKPVDERPLGGLVAAAPEAQEQKASIEEFDLVCEVLEEKVAPAVKPKEMPPKSPPLVSKPRDETAQPLVAVEGKVPAYERLAALTAPRLPLPRKFELLERLLYACDTVCSLVLARDQISIFHRIQKSLENIVERLVSFLS